MSLASLQLRIDDAIADALMPVLMDRMAERHRVNWRDCDCSWCALKRRATAVIAGVRCSDPERRADIRFHLANDFRAALMQELQQ